LAIFYFFDTEKHSSSLEKTQCESIFTIEREKKMFCKKGLLIGLLFLTACATSQKYDQKLQQWIGQSEAKLESVWGRPSAQKYLAPDSKVVTYTKVSEWFIPSEYYFYNDGWGESDVIFDPFMNEYDFTPYAQLVDSQVQEFCQTSFWIENGKITAWKWRGNDCVAR
jgi:hypothetical protein